MIAGMKQAQSIRATVMQTPSRSQLEVLPEVVIDVDQHGVIEAVGQRAGEVDVELGPDVVLLPGLIDTHIHAPQWPQLGTGLDLALEPWLFEHTFPLEKRLTDPAFAAAVWPQMVSTLLSHGTTTAVYYATIDVATTTQLAATCLELGQRAFVGRVAMDHPEGTPEWYRDQSATVAVDLSSNSIEEIRALGSELVRPIVTPRFTPACTDDALRGLAELAADRGVLVQTHCSESDWQHGHALDRYGASDASALFDLGLIRDHTVLAHGNFLSDGDFDLLRSAGSGVAHCPLSNAYFANAVFPARRALNAGVRVGLGTDIAGGASPGLLPQAAHAVTASRYLEDGVDPATATGARGNADSRLTIVEAFHLATMGGADLLGEPVGLLAPGRSFDALAVQTNRAGSPLRCWDEIDDDARRFEKIVRLGTPNDITNVWVAGRRVAGVGT